MLAPKYVWITHPWYNKEWWTQTEANVSCTANEMKQAVKNSIGVIPDGFLITNFTKSTSSGLVNSQDNKVNSRKKWELLLHVHGYRHVLQYDKIIILCNGLTMKQVPKVIMSYCKFLITN